MNLAKLCALPREQFEDWCRLRSCAIPLGNGEALCRVLGQFTFYADLLDRNLAHNLLLAGYWESWITQWLGRTVQPGWNCIDVGANHGYFSLLLSQLSGEIGHILAVEPNPRMSRFLRENLRINGLDLVAMAEVACGTEAKSAKLRWQTDDPGSGSLVNSAASGNICDVAVRPLDFLWREAHGDEPVSLVKIDAEGMDYEVLRGAAGIFAANPACVVVYEHAGLLLPSRDDEARLLAEVAAAGWGMWSIASDATLQPAGPEAVLAEPPSRVWNLVLRRP